jgi:hypothetical protein
MKTLFLTFALLMTFAGAASAQNSIKLFDPVLIGGSDYNMIANARPWGMYKEVQVYLSCPTSGRFTSTVSGPNGGNLIVDNALLINGYTICQSTNCYSSLIQDPGSLLGMPVEMAYEAVSPISVTRDISASGLYTFSLVDFGYTFGNTAVYLNTACTIIPVNTPEEPTPTPTPSPSPTPDPNTRTGGTVICHRDNGNNGGSQTIEVGGSAVEAHLAHGDTLGACGQ